MTLTTLIKCRFNAFYTLLAFVFERWQQMKKNMSKIITSFDYPPIPIRNYDWSAIREDYDEGDLIGTGRTEQDAINDLVCQENER